MEKMMENEYNYEKIVTMIRGVDIYDEYFSYIKIISELLVHLRDTNNMNYFTINVSPCKSRVSLCTHNTQDQVKFQLLYCLKDDKEKFIQK